MTKIIKIKTIILTSLLFLGVFGIARALTMQDIINGQTSGQVLGATIPAFIQGRVAASNWNVTSVNLNFDNNVTAGNLIVMLIKWGSSAVTLNSLTSTCTSNGLTLLHNPTTASDTRIAAALAYGAITSSGSCTVTANISGTAGTLSVIAHEVSGVDMTNPIDSEAVNTQNYPSTGIDGVTSGNISTSFDGDYIFGCTAIRGTVNNLQAGTSYALKQSGIGDNPFATEDRIQIAHGTIATTFTQDYSYASSITGIMALRPASGTLPPPPDTNPPSVPTNLAAIAISSSQINLSWTVSTDDTAVTGYRIYRNSTQIGTAAGNNYNDSNNLSASTAYSYTVSAVDGAGNESAQSLAVSATTQTTPPPAGSNRVDLLNSSGSVLNTFTTIQKCAGIVAAGQTCLVYPGTYDERITPAHSGLAQQPITFQAATSTRPIVKGWTLTGRSYITITGFEVTNPADPSGNGNYISFIIDGANHIRIADNYVHDTSFYAIRANGCASCSKASYLYIGKNTFTRIGPEGSRWRVMELWTDYSIIENNDASYTADFSGTFGHHNVIRGNTFHNSYKADAGGDHIDFWQSWCATGLPAPEAANYTLIENNYVHDTPDADEHFGLINGTDGCGGPTTIIVRHNAVLNGGETFYAADTNQQSAAYYHKIYNNTVRTLLSPSDHKAGATTGVTTGSWINNLFYDASAATAPFNGYGLKSGDVTSIGDYNLGFMSSGSKAWAAPISLEAHHVLNQDPLFVGVSDLHLQATSPAHDAGGPLTTVAAGDSGSGVTLLVDDAHFFQDGWAGVNADWVRVGATTAVQISSIDYNTNTLKLASPISRSPGDPVYLYKDSTGRQVLFGSAPDIGAYEYADASTLPPPDTTPPSPPTGVAVQ
jgi:hypothetical protein